MSLQWNTPEKCDGQCIQMAKVNDYLTFYLRRPQGAKAGDKWSAQFTSRNFNYSFTRELTAEVPLADAKEACAAFLNLVSKS